MRRVAVVLVAVAVLLVGGCALPDVAMPTPPREHPISAPTPTPTPTPESRGCSPSDAEIAIERFNGSTQPRLLATWVVDADTTSFRAKVSDATGSITLDPAVDPRLLSGDPEDWEKALTAFAVADGAPKLWADRTALQDVITTFGPARYPSRGETAYAVSAPNLSIGLTVTCPRRIVTLTLTAPDPRRIVLDTVNCASTRPRTESDAQAAARDMCDG